MSNFERSFSRMGYGDYGRKPYVQGYPSFAPLPPATFAGGLDYRQLGQAREGSTDDLLDVELDKRGALRRVRGLTSIEELERTASQVAVHYSLEGKTELLLFAPPYLGVRYGSSTEWYNVGFDVGYENFAFTNFGGSLIISNLTDKVWVRQSFEAGATLTPGMAPGRDYATFAGRVFAGGTLIDGRYEPAGIRWTAADSDYTAWDGLGSGFELLISNTIAGEEIVAFIPMNFDYMAVVCRSSIWVGRRTGLRDRPVDFSPRVTGLASIVPRTIQNTPLGVVYLSTAGVMLFDGNNVRSIGDPIEAGLLPISRADEANFHSAYDPVERHYFLFGPTQTFVFHLETGRWWRRSVLAKSVMSVAEFSDPKRWADLEGTWADMSGQWLDLGAQEIEYRGLVFLVTSDLEDHLAEQDPTSLTNLGIPLRPYAMIPDLAGSHEVETLGIGSVGIEYVGAGVVQLAWDSMEEDLARASNFTLPSKLRPYTFYKGVGVTTPSARARLFFLSGDPAIRRITQWVQRRGRRV